MATTSNTNFKKHAFLVIAHENPNMLQFLVSLLDFDYNDIFIHIDKKSDISEFKNITVSKSKLFFCKNRIDVRWGDISQVKCEFELLKLAHSNGPYHYYHIISGVDMPIKSNEYIHDFCDMNYSGYEFVSISFSKICQKSLIEHTKHYHLFTSTLKRNNNIYSKITEFIRFYAIELQKRLNFERKFKMTLVKGHQWNSITHNFCTYLLSKEKLLLKEMKYVNCPDEIFLQTLLWNSEYRNKLYVTNSTPFESSSLREIDWKRGTPYVWKEQDIEELKKSDALFARKFSNTSYEFVKQIISQ